MAKRKYTNIIQKVRNAISEADLDLCFDELFEGIKSRSRRSDQLLVIKGDYKRTKQVEIQGRENSNEIRIRYNDISARLMEFLSTLGKKHFKWKYREREVVELVVRTPEPKRGKSKDEKR